MNRMKVFLKSKLSRWIFPILFIGLLSYSCSIWWGLPSNVSWAVDSISPKAVIFEEWLYPYPPLHRYLLYLLYYPLTIAANLGWIDLSTTSSISLLIFLGRVLSLLMALSIIFSVFLTSLEIFSKQLPSLLSALCVLGIVSLVYYSKTMNLEVPYVFWFSWAMLFYIRAIKFDRFIDYLLFIISAVFSVCTKDQSYGLFILPSIFLVYTHLNNRKSQKIRQLIFDLSVKLLFPFILGIIIFLLIHNVIFDTSSFVEHLIRIDSAGYEAHNFLIRPQNTLQQHVFLFYRFFRDIQFNLGWPLFLIALASIVVCFFRRQEKYLLLCLLIPCLSYYLLFISIILYSRDRFVLPICLILCIFCGDLLASFLKGFKYLYKIKIGLITILFVYSFMYANSVNVLMLQDSRYTVEKWISKNIDSPTNLIYLGDIRYFPRFEKLEGITTNGISPSDLLNAVEEQEFPYIVTTSGYSINRFPKDSKEYQGFNKLYNSPSKYKLVFQHQSVPIWNFLTIEQPTSAEFYDARFKTGNFNKINPKISIFQRLNK